MDNERLIDLHSHTTMSDGSLTPKELVQLADDIKLSALAITDHNTFEGVEDAMFHAKKYNIEIIPAIEISAEFKPEIDILVYFFSNKFLTLQSWLLELQDFKFRIGPKKIIEKLNALGYKIKYEQFIKTINGDEIHIRDIAKFLVKKRYFPNEFEAMFNLFFPGCPAYVKLRPSIKEVCEIVKSVGGVPVLAHPFVYRLEDKDLDKLICEYKQYGLMGIEVYHSDVPEEMVPFLLSLAKKYNLVVTGGSDFHGKLKPHIDLGIGRGDLNLSYDILEQLRNSIK